MIENAGFPLFGMKESPFIDIHGDVRIVAGVIWSNQKADDILWLPKPHEADLLRRAGAANVFYPHRGFELEAWPRRFLVKQAREFTKHFDAIIGHHAHNPQPLELHDGGRSPTALAISASILTCRLTATERSSGSISAARLPVEMREFLA